MGGGESLACVKRHTATEQAKQSKMELRQRAT